MVSPFPGGLPARGGWRDGLQGCSCRLLAALLLMFLHMTVAAAPNELASAEEGIARSPRALQYIWGPRDENGELRIPKILHHIFILDAKDAARSNLTMWPQHERWVQACRYHYSPVAGWKYMYWDAAASDALIAQHYPFFLDFYRTNITLANEKSDVIRYVLMDQFGGLYLDSDTECWREASDMLQGFDVVLQGTHKGEGVGSASIASVPGAPLWRKTLELMLRRETTTDGKPEWWKSLERTGPNLLADTLDAVGVKPDQRKMFSEEYRTDGLVYRIYRAGEWFLPCQWFEDDCRKRVYEERASGQSDLRRVVGMHRFAGSWIEEKKDGKGIANVKLEMCQEYRRAASLLLLTLILLVNAAVASKFLKPGFLARVRSHVLLKKL